METPIRGWVAVFDPTWLGFLRAKGPMDEINFWRPTPTPMRQPEGTPWYFKAKAPVNAIVGGAYFAHYTEMPLSIAWDTFNWKNGVPSIDALRSSLSRIRNSPNTNSPHHPPATEDTLIGCVILSSPWFLEPENFIPTPTDWKPNTVVGKYYNLRIGEGRKLWDATVGNTSLAQGQQTARKTPVAGWGEPCLVRPRLGQGGFRFAVLDAYGRRCAVTQARALPVLEAAHITRYADDPSHEISNGIALRADIHKLFDLGYVGVDESGVFRVSAALRADFGDSDEYYALNGRTIILPDVDADRPNQLSLRKHFQEVFRGK